MYDLHRARRDRLQQRLQLYPSRVDGLRDDRSDGDIAGAEQSAESEKEVRKLAVASRRTDTNGVDRLCRGRDIPPLDRRAMLRLENFPEVGLG